MNINKIKIGTWYWVPKYATGINVCPWKVVDINGVTDMISLEAPSSNTMRYWRVSKDAIFVTRGEAERADKYYEEHIREIEDSQECWAVYRKDIEHVFLDGLIIEKGNVVSLQKEYLPNSRHIYWGFHPEKTSVKYVQNIPLFHVFTTKEEALQAVTRIKKDDLEKLRKLINKIEKIEPETRG